MTIEEAIEKITSDIELADYREEDSAQLVDIESLKVAIKAMEKRLPKEVVFDRVYKRCSNCGETPMYFQYSYCPYCGQKLKWSKGQEEAEK